MQEEKKMQILSQIASLIMSVIMFVFPCLDYSPKSDDVKLNAAIISDTHIDTRLPCGKAMLKKAFLDMNNNSVGNDVVIVTGDLTNYGDDETLDDFFAILTENSKVQNAIITMGNHDIGHTEDLGMTNQEARERFVKMHNEYLGTQHEKQYYSYVINGYKFIVICDESEDNWDKFEISDEQIQWLDEELAEGTANGLPVFVICHEPYVGINGQPTVWENGTMERDDGEKVKAVLQKYKNVFYISGHMHEGINGKLTQAVLGFCCVETVDGINCISLPTYTLVNRYGLANNGLGFQMEVYSDRVVFRARSFLHSVWYLPYEFTIDLV